MGVCDALTDFRVRKQPPPGDWDKSLGCADTPIGEQFLKKRAKKKTKATDDSLIGPSGPLLIKPHLILKGEKVLLEPKEMREIQSRTHVRTMKIGAEVEEMVKRLCRQQMEEAVKQKEEEVTSKLGEIMEKEVGKAIKFTKRRMENVFRSNFFNFIEFQKDYIERREGQLCRELERALEECRQTTRKAMTEEAARLLKRQRKELSARFRFKLQKAIHELTMSNLKERRDALRVIELLKKKLAPLMKVVDEEGEEEEDDNEEGEGEEEETKDEDKKSERDDDFCLFAK